MNTNGTEPNNPGTKKPFRDLKTGEVVMRFRGRAGYLPLEQSSDEGAAQVNRPKDNKDGIGELIAIAMATLKTLELTLKQIGDRYHG